MHVAGNHWHLLETNIEEFKNLKKENKKVGFLEKKNEWLGGDIIYFGLEGIL